MSDKITITNMDACEVIEEAYWNRKSTMLIDPPYYHQGENLYHCFYTEEDHIRLNVLLDTLHMGFVGGDIILTYDNAKYIEGLYIHPKIERVNRVYSV